MHNKETRLSHACVRAFVRACACVRVCVCVCCVCVFNARGVGRCILVKQLFFFFFFWFHPSRNSDEHSDLLERRDVLNGPCARKEHLMYDLVCNTCAWCVFCSGRSSHVLAIGLDLWTFTVWLKQVGCSELDPQVANFLQKGQQQPSLGASMLFVPPFFDSVFHFSTLCYFFIYFFSVALCFWHLGQCVLDLAIPTFSYCNCAEHPEAPL